MKANKFVVVQSMSVGVSAQNTIAIFGPFKSEKKAFRFCKDAAKRYARDINADLGDKAPLARTEKLVNGMMVRDMDWTVHELTPKRP